MSALESGREALEGERAMIEVIHLPEDWVDAFDNHYVLIDGQREYVENEFEVSVLAQWVRRLACDDVPSLDVFDKNGHKVGEIDASGFTAMPQERDWDAVRKEMVDAG